MACPQSGALAAVRTHLALQPFWVQGAFFPWDSFIVASGPEKTQSAVSFSTQNPQMTMVIVTINGNQPHLRASSLTWLWAWA